MSSPVAIYSGGCGYLYLIDQSLTYITDNMFLTVFEGQRAPPHYR